MFETKLPYPVFDADNHFYDAPDAITRHLEPKYVDEGKVAFDYQPDKSERHRKQMEKEFGLAVGLPGSHTYKANPLRIDDPEERAKVVQSFRLMAPAFQSRENRLEVMDVQGLEAAIMFPSGVGISVEGQFVDDAAANAANVRAYNRWVQDDWGFAYKNRIFTPANVPLANIDVMVVRARPCPRRGRPHRVAPAGAPQRQVARRPVLRPVLGAHRGVGSARHGAPQLHAVPARGCRSTATTPTLTTSTGSTRSSGSRTGATARSWRRSRR